MTAQFEERTNEARVIPDGKPILMKLIGIKASKSMKSKQSDKVTKMVSWVLVVDDRKYPECAGFYVSYRTSSWSACGKNGGRSSNCYLFIAMLLGEDADQFERVDLYDILTPYEEGQKQKLQRPDEMRDLWGKYLVGWMESPRPDDNGRVWQNAKEFKPPEFLDWEVEDRKMPTQTQEQKPLGLPIPKSGPAPAQEPPRVEDKPAPETTPTQEPPKETPGFRTAEQPITEVDQWIKDNRRPHKELIEAFLYVDRKVDRIGALSEADRRHLMAMMKVHAKLTDANETNRKVAEDVVNQHLELRGASSFEALKTSDLRLLIATIEAEINGDVPF